MLFPALLLIFYLGLYNSSQVKGNLFLITMLFGFMEAFGVVVGEKII